MHPAPRGHQHIRARTAGAQGINPPFNPRLEILNKQPAELPKANSSKLTVEGRHGIGSAPHLC